MNNAKKEKKNPNNKFNQNEMQLKINANQYYNRITVYDNVVCARLVILLTNERKNKTEINNHNNSDGEGKIEKKNK